MPATAPNTAQPPLPHPQDAFQLLTDEVGSRAFFSKLASRGHVPRTEAEVSGLLELGGKLDLAAPYLDKAADANSPYLAACAEADRALAQFGVPVLPQQKSAAADLAIGREAAALAANPAIYNAVVSLKSAQALAVAEEHGLIQPQQPAAA